MKIEIKVEMGDDGNYDFETEVSEDMDALTALGILEQAKMDIIIKGHIKPK